LGQYDTQQVCVNGHQVTDTYHRYPEFRATHCEQCGAPTIHQCPACNKEIKGDYHVDGVFVDSSAPVPTHCEACGAAFPWAGKIKKNGPKDPEELLETICLRFHLVARQLRARRKGRVTLDVSDEYDVQDLLHALLYLFFDDVRPEEWTPSNAGASARMDFFLKNESIVVEAKKTRPKLGAKEIGDQLIVDITRYKGHPGCKTLFCFVYDPEGRVTNPRGIETDLSRKDGDLTVKVFIVPRGN
jgi:hypothetical protein